MNNWGANHGAISYGHIGADLITLASILRIPICMHNIIEESIFHPSAWNSFGTADLEGADYRACSNFGPLLLLITIHLNFFIDFYKIDYTIEKRNKRLFVFN